MLVVGLTGGIGSGKSTVANLFARLGIEVIDADQIAHQLTQANTQAYAKILRHFGEKIQTVQGGLDRRKLRDLIFNDLNEKQWLENLLHPMIFAEIRFLLTKVQSPYCIVVIPLLFEVGGLEYIDRSLVIDVPEALQIERSMQRDHVNKEQVMMIMSHQISREERLRLTDDIICNDKTLAILEKEVMVLHQRYLELSSS